jgi:hypothetical protein
MPKRHVQYLSLLDNLGMKNSIGYHFMSIRLAKFKRETGVKGATVKSRLTHGHWGMNLLNLFGKQQQHLLQLKMYIFFSLAFPV